MSQVSEEAQLQFNIQKVPHLPKDANRWTIAVTRNGFQWSEFNLAFRTRAKAKQVVALLEEMIEAGDAS